MPITNQIGFGTVLAGLVLCVLGSCGGDKGPMEVVVYDGPFYEAANTRLWYSDSAVVRLMVKASKMLEYENGDQEYPEGIYVEFYEQDTTITSILEGDKAYFTKETNLYRAVGNVKLESIKEQQKLSTEELFWDVNEKQVYTDKFVIIETKEDILHGEGLTAKQDFSSYRILKPSGELGINASEE